MEVSTPVLLVIGGNLVGWLVQFVVLKTDLKWIKKRLCAGDRRLAAHERRLNLHQAKIASVQSGCSARHGAIFASVDNGSVEGGSGE